MLLLFWANVSVYAFAEDRNIYVGDIITLEITSDKYSEEELRYKFQDFEIIEIKKTPDGYLLSMRTFDVGQRTILLGDKEITINVSSTLDDIDQNDIFEGGTDVVKPGFAFHWRILLYITASIFVLTGAFIAIKVLTQKKTEPVSPYQRFQDRAALLKAEDDNYFVDLTFYFKEYIGSLYNRRIIGKTSSEITAELAEIPALETMLPDITNWLMECDKFKFTEIEVSIAERHDHYERLLNIAEKIV
jgi:hypothetical protein